MTNIIQFPDISPLTASDMLRNIADNDAPKYAFVICWPEDGTMPTYHSNTKDIPVTLMRLQEFVHRCYNGEFIVPERGMDA